MLKAVVFDLDGTLTVLALPLDAMRNDTKKFYITRGLPPDLLDPEDGISSTRVKAREYFQSQGATTDEWENMQAEIDGILSAHEGWAVLKEEVDELWDEVKRKPAARSRAAMRIEAKQI
ncbi:MAG: hypothetical protein ACFFH0_07035, partial [Promethearchaeota archaeon]